MEIVREVFNDRKNEIDLYYQLIDFLDNIEKEDGEKSINDILFNKDIEKIVRANALLMLYNLVESTLVNGIEEVYSVFRQDGIT